MNRLAVLSDYIDEVARAPFAYGVNDCLLMVAGGVERLTGVDHAAEFRGRYDSLAAGKRLIGKPVLEFIGERLLPKVPVRADDGDVAAFRQKGEWVFGLFIGAHVYVQTPKGLGILPRRVATRAFETV